MKKVLFVTSCSLDSARLLRRWVRDNSPQSVQLTVVHPYDLAPSQPLNRDNYRLARQQARAQLDGWLELLQPLPILLRAETLLATPQLATMMHLLLRSYDYVVVDENQADALLPAGVPCGLRGFVAS